MDKEKKLDKLNHIIDGFSILNADQAQDFTINLMMGLSNGVLDGNWSEESQPEAFARLRKILAENKNWFIRQEDFMHEVRVIRQEKPRTHWWWWIEEIE